MSNSIGTATEPRRYAGQHERKAVAVGEVRRPERSFRAGGRRPGIPQPPCPKVVLAPPSASCRSAPGAATPDEPRFEVGYLPTLEPAPSLLVPGPLLDLWDTGASRGRHGPVARDNQGENAATIKMRMPRRLAAL